MAENMGGFADREHVLSGFTLGMNWEQKILRFLSFAKARRIWVKHANGKFSATVKAAKPSADHALGWTRKQQLHVSSQVTKARHIQVWAHQNAFRFRWREKPASSSLEHLENTLTQVVSAILQTSDKRARIFINAVVGKFGGFAAISGFSGLITTFGTAGTGTAIATLSGAAANSAQLFWLGSWVGLGVAGGSVMLAAGGVGVGIIAGAWGRRRSLGRSRLEHDLQAHEKTILVACTELITAIQKQSKERTSPTPTEMRQVTEHALIPLAYQIDLHWDDASLKENGNNECRPFTRTLAYLQRRKLDRCRTELGRIALATMARNAAV